MRPKDPPAAWVVEVAVPPLHGGAPAFKYFNVAVRDESDAVEAARKRRDAEATGEFRAVRPLTSQEIAALRMKAGAIKPA